MDKYEDLEKRIRILEELIAYPKNPQPTPWTSPSVFPTSKGYKCQVCEMFFEYGKAYSYCCMHAKCPSKVTYSNV